MNKGLIFWVIMLLWLLYIIGAFVSPSLFIAGASNVVIFILFALLGWAVYGPAIR